MVTGILGERGKWHTRVAYTERLLYIQVLPRLFHFGVEHECRKPETDSQYKQQEGFKKESGGGGGQGGVPTLMGNLI